MEIVFLGTGTSHGVPMIACACAVCRSTDPRNQRTRTSIHVVMGGVAIQVDAAPELRLQCVRADIRRLDVFILTHPHADHVAGMDDLRRFCDLREGSGLPVYATSEGLRRVREIFPYAIGSKPAFRSYPAFVPHEMPAVLDLGGGTISSVVLPHGGMDVLGLVFEERGTGAKFAYYTDCKEVGAEARRLAAGAEVVVLDGLRPEAHPTHMSIGEALVTAREMGAPLTYLTHLTHAVDHGAIEAGFPANVRLAWDGLHLRLPGPAAVAPATAAKIPNPPPAPPDIVT